MIAPLIAVLSLPPSPDVIWLDESWNVGSEKNVEESANRKGITKWTSSSLVLPSPNPVPWEVKEKRTVSAPVEEEEEVKKVETAVLQWNWESVVLDALFSHFVWLPSS